VHGDIISVQFPPWAANQTVSPLPDWKAQITAVDLLDQVHPGATHVLLATLNLKGNVSTFSSTIPLNISVNELDDNGGNTTDTNNMPANILVVRLLPFPTKTNCSSDPYGDQIYWDVNGNGRIDFDDVITYYQNMQWIRDNQYRPFFNYNGNVEVPPNYGIDFADLIALFNRVGS
jgi:PKD repeat protein